MPLDLLSSDDDELERQQRQQRHSQGLQTAAQGDTADTDFVKAIVDTGLDPGTAEMLTNLLQSDWMLGNLDDAEVHEARWLARTIADEVVDMHPSGRSLWQGELREYAAADSAQKLRPLNSAEQTKIFQLIQAFTVNVTRSEDMEQQEIFRKSINESRTVDRDKGSGGWGL